MQNVLELKDFIAAFLMLVTNGVSFLVALVGFLAKIEHQSIEDSIPDHFKNYLKIRGKTILIDPRAFDDLDELSLTSKKELFCLGYPQVGSLIDPRTFFESSFSPLVKNGCFGRIMYLIFNRNKDE